MRLGILQEHVGRTMWKVLLFVLVLCQLYHTHVRRIPGSLCLHIDYFNVHIPGWGWGVLGMRLVSQFNVHIPEWGSLQVRIVGEPRNEVSNNYISGMHPVINERSIILAFYHTASETALKLPSTQDSSDSWYSVLPLSYH